MKCKKHIIIPWSSAIHNTWSLCVGVGGISLYTVYVHKRLSFFLILDLLFSIFWLREKLRKTLKDDCALFFFLQPLKACNKQEGSWPWMESIYFYVYLHTFVQVLWQERDQGLLTYLYLLFTCVLYVCDFKNWCLHNTYIYTFGHGNIRNLYTFNFVSRCSFGSITVILAQVYYTV